MAYPHNKNTTQGVHSGKQAQRSTVSSAPSMRRNRSKGKTPNMPEEGTSVSSGPELCDASSCCEPAVKSCLTCMDSNYVPPPGQIQFDSVQPDSVSLRWSPPEGAPGHRSFMVTWTAAQEHRSLKVTGVALVVTELTPGEMYHFTVATLSQDGHQSTCVKGTVYTEVPPPQDLQVSLSSRKASLTWTKPAGVDQVAYLLEICRDQEQINICTNDSNSCSYTINDLQPAADYTIRVSTVLSNGRQSEPTSKSFRAEPAGPGQHRSGHTSSACEAAPFYAGPVSLPVSICLLGETGSGKSASGNTILGSEKFPSITFGAPVTTQCQSASTSFYGTQIKVIDTPDFFDDDLKQSSRHVMKCRQMYEGGLCVYLLVIQIGRFTEGERDILERLERALETRIRDRAIILFTHGDDLRSQHIDDYIRNTNTHLQSLIGKCGNRYQVFNNRNKQEAAKQKEKLMKKIGKLVQGSSS